MLSSVKTSKKLSTMNCEPPSTLSSVKTSKNDSTLPPPAPPPSPPFMVILTSGGTTLPTGVTLLIPNWMSSRCMAEAESGPLKTPTLMGCPTSTLNSVNTSKNESTNAQACAAPAARTSAATPNTVRTFVFARIAFSFCVSLLALEPSPWRFRRADT